MKKKKRIYKNIFIYHFIYHNFNNIIPLNNQ